MYVCYSDKKTPAFVGVFYNFPAFFDSFWPGICGKYYMFILCFMPVNAGVFMPNFSARFNIVSNANSPSTVPTNVVPFAIATPAA